MGLIVILNISKLYYVLVVIVYRINDFVYVFSINEVVGFWKFGCVFFLFFKVLRGCDI